MAEPSKPMQITVVRPPTERSEEKHETTKFTRKTIIIGRDTDCDVRLKDPKASRKHCKLMRCKDGFILEDLGSKNGTFVEGKRITEPVTLKLSQTFKVGDTVIYLG